jgi:hypothetical protein
MTTVSIEIILFGLSLYLPIWSPTRVPESDVDFEYCFLDGLCGDGESGLTDAHDSDSYSIDIASEHSGMCRCEYSG